MQPVVGIPACSRLNDERPRYDVLARYCEAVLGGAGAIPLLIPPLGPPMLGTLDRLDGLLLPGSPSNVHPDLYQGGESRTPDLHDDGRDATTLPLIREAVARGLPVLAICRGIQELNVALGGTLHQTVHELPGRTDHRGGAGTQEERYAPKHDIAVRGTLAAIVGAPDIRVNSVHGQAIDTLAPGLVVEAEAPDGTIEAVRLAGARGFVLGVQWHPEWRFASNPDSRALFAAFGAACRDHAASIRKAA